MPDNDGLSERELEILKLVATGASNKEIARKLSISTNTVKVHLRNIFAKIGAASRTEAAMYAVRLGLVPVSSVYGNSAYSEIGEDAGQLITSEYGLSPRQSILSGWAVAIIIGVIIVLLAISILLYRQIYVRTTTATVPNNLTSSETVERWQVIAPMPTARYGFALVNFDYKIYAFSGQTQSGITGVVERYDTIADKWETMTAKPTAVRDISAAVVGGKIYIPGGQRNDGTVVKTLEIYDPELDHWTQGEDLPKALSAYAIIAYEGNIYLFGGWDGKKYVADVYEYLPEEDQWRALSPLPEPRGYCGIAVNGGKIYILGGYNGTQILANNTVYSPDKEGSGETPWTEAPPLANGRYAMGVTYLADIIYVIGGETAKGQPNDPVQFVPQSGAWQAFDQPPTELGSGLGLVAIGNYLYAMGGQVSGTPLTLNQTYQALYAYSVPIIIK